MYDATRGGHIDRIVEQLTVRGDTIAAAVFVADMAAFTTFGAP